MSGLDHPSEQLDDLLDGRLGAVDAAAVRAHVDACAECQRELEWLSAGRAGAARARTTDAAPDDLRALVTAALDDVDRHATRPHAPSGRRGVLWAGVAAAAAFVLYLTVPWRLTAPDPVEQARSDYAAVRAGSLPLDRVTADAADLERYFNEPARGPRIRVIDLGMMGWTIDGGVERRLGGERSALYAYRSASGTRLVCQMYAGRIGDLPTADQTRHQNGFEFRIYTRDGVTLVFWQEGEVVCVLAADLPAAEVVALAEAKAMAPG